ncbi:MAG: hypothetical protein QHJ81_01955 [Anaerolineae bacterium]|nr:hypothetical protein [Anaerolineae bacterium]
MTTLADFDAAIIQQYHITEHKLEQVIRSGDLKLNGTGKQPKSTEEEA